MNVAIFGERAVRVAGLLRHPALEYHDSGPWPPSADWPANADLILASPEPASDNLARVLEAARSVRRDLCFWGPIYLLLPDTLSIQDPEIERRLVVERWNVYLYDDQWAIYLDRVPPRDVPALVEDLAAAEPIPLARRENFYLDSLYKLALDVASFIDRCNPDCIITAQEIRGSIERVVQEIEHVRPHVSLPALVADASRLLTVPVLAQHDISNLRGLIVAAEKQVMHTNRSVYAALHTLKNHLALRAESTPVFPRMSRISALQREASRDVDLCHILERIGGVRQPETQSLTATVRGEITDGVRALYRWLQTNDSRMRTPPDLPVGRILVIEDHPKWSDRLMSLIERLSTGLPIQSAADAKTAEALLSEGPPALALVDLGLPPEPGLLQEAETGIALIRRFTGTQQGVHLQHRFIILTAAEEIDAVVRDALELGLEAANYVQKDQSDWDLQVIARIRIALQAPSEQMPFIQVLAQTSRVARIDGVEIVLDYPHWCLLAALAQRPRLRFSRERLAEILALEPYCLNPKRRDPRLASDDARDAVFAQIPHYASELRKKLDWAYRQAHRRPTPSHFLEAGGDQSYCLNARASVVRREIADLPSRAPHVLVVEDSPLWRDRIVERLQNQGFYCVTAASAEAAREVLDSKEPDLLSLDIEIPKNEIERQSGLTDPRNAIALFSHVRQTVPDVRIAVLTATAWSDEIDIAMLRGGIRLDDYIRKTEADPIGRLATSLWRLWQEAMTQTRIVDWDPNVTLHSVLVDPASRLVTAIAGRPFDAGSGKESILLRVLTETPNRFVGRWALMQALWTENPPENLDQSLNSIVQRLRHAIYDQTTIPGNEVISSDRGAYMLRGIVKSATDKRAKS